MTHGARDDALEPTCEADGGARLGEPMTVATRTTPRSARDEQDENLLDERDPRKDSARPKAKVGWRSTPLVPRTTVDPSERRIDMTKPALKLISGTHDDLVLEAAELLYTDEEGYHVRRLFVASTDCTVEGATLRRGDRATSLLLADTPVHVIEEFPWDTLWESMGPTTVLSGGDAALREELEVFLEGQATYLRKKLGRGLLDILDRQGRPALLGRQISSIVQLPNTVVRTPEIFGDPLRRPARVGKASHVQVTFPHSIAATLPVVDGQLVTLQPIDFSVYAVCCAKWELTFDSASDTAPWLVDVRYTAYEIARWLGIDENNGGNLRMVRDSMERLGAITFKVPRWKAGEGEGRLQFQLLERHHFHVDAHWGYFQLPEIVVEELQSGKKTLFRREVLNQLRRVSPTAVYLYGALLTHRGWDDHPSGQLEFRLSMGKLKTLINRTDRNESRVRKDVMRAAEAIAELDARFAAPSLTRGAQTGAWVFRMLKARQPETVPRVRAAEQPRRLDPPRLQEAGTGDAALSEARGEGLPEGMRRELVEAAESGYSDAYIDNLEAQMRRVLGGQVS